MSYADFTLKSVLRAFTLRLAERANLFAEVAEIGVGPDLRAMIDENYPLATAINSEKARSELIVVPILLEIRRLKDRQIGYFSGIRFDVAPEQGLSGVCDFILSRSPEQLVLGAPILTIVEAKNDNIKSGLGQCVAEMVAARIFNEREGLAGSSVFGAVTTASLWQFLRLEGDLVTIDRAEYHIDRLGKILAILLHCVGDVPPAEGSTTGPTIRQPFENKGHS